MGCLGYKSGRIWNQRSSLLFSISAAGSHLKRSNKMYFNRLAVFLLFAISLATLTLADPVSPLDSIDLGDKVKETVLDVLGAKKDEGCIWKGTSPFCDGGCNVPGHIVREVSNTGDGERCLTGIKVRCCPSSLLTKL